MGTVCEQCCGAGSAQGTPPVPVRGVRSCPRCGERARAGAAHGHGGTSALRAPLWGGRFAPGVVPAPCLQHGAYRREPRGRSLIGPSCWCLPRAHTFHPWVPKGLTYGAAGVSRMARPLPKPAGNLCQAGPVFPAPLRLRNAAPAWERHVLPSSSLLPPSSFPPAGGGHTQSWHRSRVNRQMQ